MTELDMLAEEVAVSGRTLRRAAARGTIRCRRHGPRRIAVPAAEWEYVRRHWRLLEAALQVLRTRPNVRLAVLFGSAARGELAAGSDVDLLIRQEVEDWRERVQLAERLEEALGRRVQLVQLEEAPSLLLADVLRHSRVLVDRDDDWARIRGQETEIAREARAEDARLEAAAWEILA
jgi:predicted nucleotidyltransferase